MFQGLKLFLVSRQSSGLDDPELL